MLTPVQSLMDEHGCYGVGISLGLTRTEVIVEVIGRHLATRRSS